MRRATNEPLPTLYSRSCYMAAAFLPVYVHYTAADCSLLSECSGTGTLQLLFSCIALCVVHTSSFEIIELE